MQGMPHVDGATVRVRHPRAAELHLGGVVGAEVEGHAVALDVRGNDTPASSLEVCEFLALHRDSSNQADRNGN